ncbi:MAG: hypothetical protein ABI068_07380 [Ktedonobacterales bacterium]
MGAPILVKDIGEFLSLMQNLETQTNDQIRPLQDLEARLGDAINTLQNAISQIEEILPKIQGIEGQMNDLYATTGRNMEGMSAHLQGATAMQLGERMQGWQSLFKERQGQLDTLERARANLATETTNLKQGVGQLSFTAVRDDINQLAGAVQGDVNHINGDRGWAQGKVTAIQEADAGH